MTGSNPSQNELQLLTDDVNEWLLKGQTLRERAYALQSSASSYLERANDVRSLIGDAPQVEEVEPSQ